MNNKSNGTTIELHSCAKTYKNNYTALQPLNLKINAGETIVLLGPSGCGKTTLLRIIAGLEEVNKGGRILFNNKDVTNLTIDKRDIGMVFQSYALFPNMNVFENIAYGLKIKKFNKKELNIRVNEMLDMMNISSLKDRKISQLSGGQKQRVALARAIATRPKVLLLDEPLSALDALLRKKLRIEINKLLKELGITTIYVTHDQEEAMSLGDRIVVMEKGRISQIGTAYELYYNPINNFTAEFIGSINRIQGDFFLNTEKFNSWKFFNDSLIKESNIDILFRPEDAKIKQTSNSDFSGRLKQSIFLGDKTKLILDMNEQEIIIETKEHNKYQNGEIINFDIEDDSFILMPRI